MSLSEKNAEIEEEIKIIKIRIKQLAVLAEKITVFYKPAWHSQCAGVIIEKWGNIFYRLQSIANRMDAIDPSGAITESPLYNLSHAEPKRTIFSKTIIHIRKRKKLSIVLGDICNTT